MIDLCSFISCAVRRFYCHDVYAIGVAAAKVETQRLARSDTTDGVLMYNTVMVQISPSARWRSSQVRSGTRGKSTIARLQAYTYSTETMIQV